MLTVNECRVTANIYKLGVLPLLSPRIAHRQSRLLQYAPIHARHGLQECHQIPRSKAGIPSELEGRLPENQFRRRQFGVHTILMYLQFNIL